MQYYFLETSRLTLKGIPYNTLTSIFDSLLKQEVMTILGHKSDDEYQKELEKHLNGYSSYSRRFIMFLLVDKSTERIIGRCGLHNWNQDHLRAEIGYIMNDEEFKRKGLMTEAVAAVLEFGFTQLKLNRIDAMVGAGNSASLRIIEKSGFVKEGVLRVLFSKLAGE
jgi:[ribosomal protein S5]-alanine N-acetyltransferase